tara:strand:- start:3649 stop:4296 length:648 start_codon:yes stop_codon:yes gene_type:complete
MAHLTFAQAGPIETGSSERQHLVREIDTNTSSHRAAEDFQDAARTGTDINYALISRPRNQREHFVFNLGFIDMKRPEPVPFGSVFAKIGIGGCLPGLPYLGKALHIPQELGVVLWDSSEYGVDQTATAHLGAVSAAIKNPGTLSKTMQQPRIAQQFKMARDPGLALPEDMGEFGDSQFAIGADCQDAEPGLFGGGFELNEKILHQMHRVFSSIFI